MKSSSPWLAMALLLTTAPAAYADSSLRFAYAAHFACGENPGATDRVLPGRYATTVNVHNPGASDVALELRLALAFPPDVLAPGPVSPVVEVVLPAGGALQVDCEEILGETFFAALEGPPYLLGFVEIRSRGRVDVQSFSTVTTQQGVVSATVLSVPERRIFGGHVLR